MASEPDREPLSPLPFHIPPEDAITLAVLVLEALDMAWRRKRTAISSRVTAFGTDLLFAIEQEGGVPTLVRETFTRKR